MAATKIDNNSGRFGVSIHDGLDILVYRTTGFTFSGGGRAEGLSGGSAVRTFVVYSTNHGVKFVGAGVTLGPEEICPEICAYRLRELDIVGVFSSTNKGMPHANEAIRLVENLEEYKNTIHKSRWKTMLAYAYGLRGYHNGQTKGDLQSAPSEIASFSATPQGGGVARMSNALADPEAFKMTKTDLKVLRGVVDPEAIFGAERQAILHTWMRTNAECYWLSPVDPLSPGGADVVIIDDPQMAAHIPLIQEARPEVGIVYCSHIEVRKDLAAIPGSPQEQHELVCFHHLVGISRAGAGGCGLGGLDKHFEESDLIFCHNNPHNSCDELEMNHLLYPEREYITQIAGSDHSKGIPDVIESYRKLCALIIEVTHDRVPPPSLLYLGLCSTLICGSGAIDDPDAEIAATANHVMVVIVWPSGQRLNAMITTAKIVVQLPLREEIEVKVSQALHHRKPVVSTRTVANHLFDLYTNEDLYVRISKHAKESVSDQVGTTGNAACGFYLAAKLDIAEGFSPDNRLIIDTVMEEAGQKYESGLPILPRREIYYKHES
ncbi:hypothetical protein HOY80DRAFT_1114690 [Tuber brumale]|nr:hypothetical protein HOY80DRAFT_1114690 [Tuber brumale]